MIACMAFAIKTFFTGVFLAWGFANGHIIHERATELYALVKEQILAFFATWPGLRNWLVQLFAKATPDQFAYAQ